MHVHVHRWRRLVIVITFVPQQQHSTNATSILCAATYLFGWTLFLFGGHNVYIYIYIGWNCVLLDRKMDQCVCVCENFVAFLRLRVLLCVCICAVGWVGHPWVMFQFENIES